MFLDILLTVIRDDFRVELKIWNLFELQNKAYQELLTEAAAINPEIAQVQQHPVIQKSELDVL